MHIHRTGEGELIQDLNLLIGNLTLQFAAYLKLHAKNEEEVTYPTAILIGEYLKLKLKY